MNQKTIISITTDDTKKTYTWVDGKPQGEIPQLFALEITNIGCVENGRIPTKSSYQIYSGSTYVVERDSIYPKPQKKEDPPQPTAEELLVDLLLKLGFTQG